MATVKGVNYTLMTAVPVDHVLPDIADGRVRFMYDTYEASSLGAGSVIQLFRVLDNWRILDWKIWHDALGGSSTLDLGDVADPNRYNTAEDSSSAGIIVPLVAEINTGAFYKYTSDDIVSITTAGASISGTIHVGMWYVID